MTQQRKISCWFQHWPINESIISNVKRQRSKERLVGAAARNTTNRDGNALNWFIVATLQSNFGRRKLCDPFVISGFAVAKIQVNVKHISPLWLCNLSSVIYWGWRNHMRLWTSIKWTSPLACWWWMLRTDLYRVRSINNRGDETKVESI